MRWIVIALALLLVASLPADARWPGIGGAANPSLGYTGPCDLQTCAEAWGVDYAMTTNYAGPLFRLALIASPTMTYDVGQTPSHSADVAGALAFCGGSGTMSALSPAAIGVSINTSSTCKIDTIYAQIQGHANDLVYSQRGSFFGCAPSNLQCAATYGTETTSGLPLLVSVKWPLGNAPTYTLINDGFATGIPGGANSVSIVYVGSPLISGTPSDYNAGYCCGVFGLTHQGVQPDTTGTDFMFLAGYGWFNSGGSGVNVNCVTNHTYCVGAEEESTNDVGDYAATGGAGVIVPNIHNIMGAAVFNQPTATVSAFLNGVNVFNHSPPAPNSVMCSNPNPLHPCPLIPGNAIHFGGGGDLSQPDPFIAREMLIINAALTGPQYSGLFTNVQTRYPTLAFTSP